MSDSESESSGNELLKEWTLVSNLGEAESDDSTTEAVTVNGSDKSVSYHSSRKQRTSSLSEECFEVKNDNQSPDETVTDFTGDMSSYLPHVSTENANTEQFLPGTEEGQSSYAGLQIDLESLSSGSSIELLEIPEETFDVCPANFNATRRETLNDDLETDCRSAADVECSLIESSHLSCIEGLFDEHPVNSEVDIDCEPVPSKTANEIVASCEMESADDAAAAAAETSADYEQYQSAVNCNSAQCITNDEVRQEVDSFRDSFETNPSAAEVDEKMATEEASSQLPSNSEAVTVEQQALSDACLSCASDQEASNRNDIQGADVAAGSVDEPNGGAIAAGSAEHTDDLHERMQFERMDSSSNSSWSIPSHVYDEDDADEAAAATEDAANDNIDDRCESDISGIATDDTDLSTVSNIDDVPLAAGDVVRSYRHQPNPTFNSTLTYTALIALLFACGIGIGHYMGSTRVSPLHQQQLSRLQSLHDEYFVCLSQLDNQESTRLDQTVEAKPQQLNEMPTERSVLNLQLNDSVEVIISKLNRSLGKERRCNKRVSRMTDEKKRWLQRSKVQLESSEQLTAMFKTCCNEQEHLKVSLLAELVDERKASSVLANEIELLKNTVNILRIKNADLRDHIRRLRYTKHPGNQDDVVTGPKDELDELKNAVNQLKIENEDLKSYVRSLRYTAYQESVVGIRLSDVSSGPDTKKAAPDLEQSSDRVNLPESDSVTSNSLPVNESTTATSSSWEFRRLLHLTDPMDIEWQAGDSQSSSVFVTLLKSLISLAGNATDETLAPVYHDAVQRVADCIQVLKNASVGQRMSDILTSTWDRLPVNAAVEMCRRHLTTDQVIASDKNESGQSLPRVEDVYRRYMNKTFETVAKLSSAIQTTLNRMKTIPEDLLAENKTARKIVQKLSGVVAKLENQVRGGWTKFSHNLESASRKWFDRSDKVTEKSSSGKMERRKGDQKKSSKGAAKRQKDQQRKSDKRKPAANNRNSKDGKMAESPLLFERNPVERLLQPVRQWLGVEKPIDVQKLIHSPVDDHHPQSQQATDSRGSVQQTGSDGPQQKYEDFWKHGKYDPDDYLPDGFLEGNHREWRRQHEGRLRAVYVRLQRLNEDMFISMDDDDIEDIHEMISDFAEDSEGRDEPVKFRTWISCQARWWKSRLHRKHRSEDLITGCGLQLMRWQLRILCNGSIDGKEVKEVCSAAASTDEVVLPPKVMNKAKGDKGDLETDRDHHHLGKSKNIELDHFPDGINARTNRNQAQSGKPSLCVTDFASNAAENATETDDINEAAWYFRLVQHREDSHQPKSDWYFSLMEERQIERSDAYWYFRSIRSEADHHIDHQEKASHGKNGHRYQTNADHRRHPRKN